MEQDGSCCRDTSHPHSLSYVADFEDPCGSAPPVIQYTDPAVVHYVVVPDEDIPPCLVH
jgi:hypothetical protein